MKCRKAIFIGEKKKSVSLKGLSEIHTQAAK